MCISDFGHAINVTACLHLPTPAYTFLLSKYIPPKTKAVPANCQLVIGSFKKMAPKNSVDTGPIMPACEVLAAPMRLTAIIVKNTGNTVQKDALTSDNHSTALG